jgi:hypothetical protein
MVVYHIAAISFFKTKTVIMQEFTDAKNKDKGEYILPFYYFCSLRTSGNGFCRGIVYHIAAISNK